MSDNTDHPTKNISLEKPGSGLYEDGAWRYTERGNDGNIVYCRYATPAEVMWWEQLCATQEQTRVVQQLIDEIRAVQTYGLRIAK